jgi:hypothetical protein
MSLGFLAVCYFIPKARTKIDHGSEDGATDQPEQPKRGRVFREPLESVAAVVCLTLSINLYGNETSCTVKEAIKAVCSIYDFQV